MEIFHKGGGVRAQSTLFWNKFFGILGGKNEKIPRMVRNAQKMISSMFFIFILYFPLLGGGVNEVWKISTQFIFFFEGFPYENTKMETRARRVWDFDWISAENP